MYSYNSAPSLGTFLRDYYFKLRDPATYTFFPTLSHYICTGLCKYTLPDYPVTFRSLIYGPLRPESLSRIMYCAIAASALQREGDFSDLCGTRLSRFLFTREKEMDGEVSSMMGSYIWERIFSDERVIKGIRRIQARCMKLQVLVMVINRLRIRWSKKIRLK